MTSANAPGPRDWILLIGLSLIWGTAFMSVEVALRTYPPMTIAAVRVALGAATLIAIGQLTGQGLATIPSGRAWGSAAAFGMAAAAIPFTLLAWGQTQVPSAFAGVSMGAVPLLTLLLVMRFAPEDGIGPRRIAGVALGFAGLFVLVGPGAFDPGAGDYEFLGRLACAASALFYAAGNIITRRAPPMPPIAMAAAALTAATIVLVPVAIAVDGLPRNLTGELATLPLLALIWTAIGPTGIAALLQVRIIQSAGPLFLSMVSYMVPLWSVILGVSVLNERLSPTLFMALAIILSGIALSQWSTLRRRNTDAP